MSLVSNQIWKEQHSQGSSKRLPIVWEELPALIRGNPFREGDEWTNYFDFALSLSDFSIDQTQTEARGSGSQGKTPGETEHVEEGREKIWRICLRE